MVMVLWMFLAIRPRRSSSALLTSSCLSRLTDRADLEAGRAQQAHAFRTGPSRGTMTLDARRQLSPVLPCAG